MARYIFFFSVVFGCTVLARAEDFKPLQSPPIKKSTTTAVAQSEPKEKTPIQTKAAGAKKKTAKSPESRYKTREISEGVEHSYRFDSRGNPLGSGAEKKPAAKPKKKAAAAKEDQDERKPACTAEEPCLEKGSDADAL